MLKYQHLQKGYELKCQQVDAKSTDEWRAQQHKAALILMDLI
jgi:hypothetical protein